MIIIIVNPMSCCVLMGTYFFNNGDTSSETMLIQNVRENMRSDL